jgi:galactose mutarotase-like enzyme
MVRHIAGAVPRIELHVGSPSEALVEIAPTRGGIVTRFSVAGREQLYLDEATLLDPTKNVRGGVPILFPSPGKLTGDRWARDGKSGALKQHGFARNLAWTLVEEGPDARVVLRLEDTAETRADYPWSFRFDLAYSLTASALRLDATITNTGVASLGPMPFGIGYHPYLQASIESKGGARVDSRATRAFDNRTGRDVDFSAESLALDGAEIDLHLLDHGATSSALTFADGHSVALEGSAVFRRWVLWTLPMREFICVEPWSCPGDALNTGADLARLDAGASARSSLEIRATSPRLGARDATGVRSP